MYDYDMENLMLGFSISEGEVAPELRSAISGERNNLWADKLVNACRL